MEFKTELEKLGSKLQLNISAECVFAINATECMKKIDKAEADLVTLDGGHILMAGNVLISCTLLRYLWHIHKYLTLGNLDKYLEKLFFLEVSRDEKGMTANS